jgi:NDP-sugar pyrophosphorylase family protein
MLVKEAVILSGGSGTRLRSVTQNKIPKAMTKIKGLSILEWQLQWLSREDVSHIVFAVGHLFENIQSYFGSSYSSKYGDIDISYSIEKEKLGTGGAFKATKNLLSENDVYVLNGDIMCNTDLSIMNNIHFNNNAHATMMVYNMISPYGIVKINDKNLIYDFVEKPQLDIPINAGLSIISKDIIDRFPDKGQMETTIFRELTNERKFYSYLIPNDNFWMSIDTEKDYIMANESWNGV